jgi:hypothetical protein
MAAYIIEKMNAPFLAEGGPPSEYGAHHRSRLPVEARKQHYMNSRQPAPNCFA